MNKASYQVRDTNLAQIRERHAFYTFFKSVHKLIIDCTIIVNDCTRPVNLWYLSRVLSFSLSLIDKNKQKQIFTLVFCFFFSKSEKHAAQN